MNTAESSLDLSRRRVAAISFLANISTDDHVREIRLDCLQVKSDLFHRVFKDGVRGPARCVTVYI